MVLDSKALASQASAGIESVGVRAYLVKKAKADAANPLADQATQTEYPVTVIYSRWENKLVDGSLVRVNDQKVLLSVKSLNGVVPEVGDELRSAPGVKGLTLVAPLHVLAPTGAPLLYTLNVRG